MRIGVESKGYACMTKAFAHHFRIFICYQGKDVQLWRRSYSRKLSDSFARLRIGLKCRWVRF